MDSALERHVTEAAGKVQPGAALDFGIILQILTQLFSLIGNCPFGGAKKAMKAGSTEAKVAIYTAVKKSGFGGNAVDLTNELIERGKNATDEELDETIAGAMSLPGLSKFCALLLAIALCGSTVPAGPFPSVSDGPFPLTTRGDPQSSATVVTPSRSGGEHPASLPAPELSLPRTTVCQCQGYREHLCHCLKAGQKCHCTRTSGSVWAVNEQGRATHKTGAKADPRKPPSSSRDAGAIVSATAPAPGATSAGFVPELRSDGKYHWDDGKVTWWYSEKPTDGQVLSIDGTWWECVSGRMRLKGSVMAADIAPKSSGHWETYTVCRGDYCTTHRRWVND